MARIAALATDGSAALEMARCDADVASRLGVDPPAETPDDAMATAADSAPALDEPLRASTGRPGDCAAGGGDSLRRTDDAPLPALPGAPRAGDRPDMSAARRAAFAARAEPRPPLPGVLGLGVVLARVSCGDPAGVCGDLTVDVACTTFLRMGLIAIPVPGECARLRGFTAIPPPLAVMGAELARCRFNCPSAATSVGCCRRLTGFCREAGVSGDSPKAAFRDPVEPTDRAGDAGTGFGGAACGDTARATGEAGASSASTGCTSVRCESSKSTVREPLHWLLSMVEVWGGTGAAAAGACSAAQEGGTGASPVGLAGAVALSQFAVGGMLGLLGAPFVAAFCTCEGGGPAAVGG